MGLTLLAAVVVACSAAPAKAERLCTPDANVYCRCADRAEGTKKCKADGQSFEACVPCDGTGSRSEGGSDGLGAGHGTDEGDEGDAPAKKGGEPDGQPTPKLDAGSPPETTTPEDGTPKNDGGTNSGTNSKRDAGGNTNGNPDDNVSFPDTAHCKPLKNSAPRIELQKIADVAGAAAGGTVADGLYVQSWVVQFTGEDGEAGPSKHYSSETLEITGDVGRYVFDDDEGKSAAGGFRLTADGKTVTVAYECPAAAPKELHYDATASTLIIYDPPYARVFIRQKGATK